MGGNQGDAWNRGTYDFTKEISNGQAFQVIFEAERGPTSAGDIALDDITFSDCSHGECSRQ